jgi:hypothetical protein
MKKSFPRLRPLLGLAGIVFALGAVPAQAADVIVSKFNDETSATGWRFDYGGVAHTIEFDATQDAQSSGSSGSLKTTLTFDPSLDASGNNKGAITIDLPSALAGANFVTMELDVRIAPGSAADSSGNSGYFQAVIRNTGGYNFNSQFGGNVSTNDGWRHITVTPLVGAHEDIRALTFEVYGGAALSGPVVLEIDNVKFTAPGAGDNEIIVNKFNDESEVGLWRFDYGSGGIENALAFSTDDADGDPASGSLRLDAGYGPGAVQAAFTTSLPAALDGSAFLGMELDVKIDPASALDQFGNAVYFQLAIRNGAGFSYNKVFEGNIGIASTNNGWQHIAIGKLPGSVDDIRGITLDLYDNNYTNFNGSTTLYIDNIKFLQGDTNAPPPPPALSIEKATSGLNLIPLGVYNRENIAAVDNTSFGWVGAGEPITYSINIAKYPDSAHPGFQTHLILDASGGLGPDTYADYSRPNVYMLDIQNQADGTVFASFRYKTNEPAGNTFLYGAGSLGGVSSPTGVGTWSVTLANETNITVTAPNGATFTTNLPPETVALFAGTVNVMLGAQANNNGGIGQTVVIKEFKIQRGGTVLLDDKFSTDLAGLDPAVWQTAAVDAAAIVPAGPDALYWVNWTLPATGFVLQSNPNIANKSGWTWSPLISAAYGNVRKVLVHSSELPAGPQAFFRLVSPPPPGAE